MDKIDISTVFKDLVRRCLRLGALFVICSATLAITCLVFFNDGIDALPQNARADRIVIEKQAHKMTLYRKGAELRSYKVSLGRSGLGQKTQAGDNLTPEGKYRVTEHVQKSGYHLALRINYPNADDLKRAKSLNVLPGGDIMIHGIRNHMEWIGTAHRLFDWTKGCVAVTNPEIEEIFRIVPDGTPVEIKK